MSVDKFSTFLGGYIGSIYQPATLPHFTHRSDISNCYIIAAYPHSVWMSSPHLSNQVDNPFFLSTWWWITYPHRSFRIRPAASLSPFYPPQTIPLSTGNYHLWSLWTTYPQGSKALEKLTQKKRLLPSMDGEAQVIHLSTGPTTAVLYIFLKRYKNHSI